MSGPVDVLSVLDGDIDGTGDALKTLRGARRVDCAIALHDLKEARAAVAELIESASDVVDSTVTATTYPDGPCIDRKERQRLSAALARVRGEAK